MDTVSISVSNLRKEEIQFIISMEINRNGEWKEFLADIFEPDRNSVHRHSVSPHRKMILKYPVRKISKEYQKLWNGKRFRLGMTIFPHSPYQDAEHIYSKSFILKWI